MEKFIDENIIIQEHGEFGYRRRTQFNVDNSDLTVAFGLDFNTAGEVLTKKLAVKKNEQAFVAISLDYEPIGAARILYKTIKTLNNTGNTIKTINIAGNGIYTLNKFDISQTSLNRYMFLVLQKVHEHLPIAMIRSGGQTGVDTAGIVAAIALNIPSACTFPKNFTQRNEKGFDYNSNEKALRRNFYMMAEELKQPVPSMTFSHR